MATLTIGTETLFTIPAVKSGEHDLTDLIFPDNCPGRDQNYSFRERSQLKQIPNKPKVKVKIKN